MRLLSVRSYPQAILHLDADAFFASVEAAKNPKLRGKPVVTGQERGIASSMSYEAKALGITRATPIHIIRKLFPQVVIVHSDYEAYAMYSKRMFAIVRRYTDAVEEYSIDECFADLTGFRRINKMTYEETLRKIQEDIQTELNISVSLGCGPTKVLAKVGSKFNKPHGITMIPGKQAHEFLSKIPIENIWGIGQSSAALLQAKGIKTAYDFAVLPEDKLLSFAHKPLIDMWNELNCRSVMKINISQEKDLPQSISRTLSFFPCKTNRNELFSELTRNIENACIKARSHSLSASSIMWFLKTKDFRFQKYEIRLERPTNIPSVVLEKIRPQFEALNMHGMQYRTTGVTLSNFSAEGQQQNDLFWSSEQNSKMQEVYKVVDLLGKKYGRHVLKLATGLNTHNKDTRGYKATHSQLSFFDKLKKTGKELAIPYLGDVI
jgi:DNA polymerase-4